MTRSCFPQRDILAGQRDVYYCFAPDVNVGAKAVIAAEYFKCE